MNHQDMSIGKNTAIGMATDVAVVGLGVLVSIVLTRSLGSELRGVYVLLTTTNFIVASFAHLSIGIACSTFLARGRLKLGEVNTVAALIAAVMGALSVLVVSLAFFLLYDILFRGIKFEYLLIALLLIPASIYQAYWNSMMVGLGRIVLLNKLNLGINISNALLMILFVGILFPANVLTALLVWSFSAFIGALCSAMLATRIEPFSWPPKRETFREMLGFGLRGHGANIAQQLFLRLDYMS